MDAARIGTIAAAGSWQARPDDPAILDHTTSEGAADRLSTLSRFHQLLNRHGAAPPSCSLEESRPYLGALCAPKSSTTRMYPPRSGSRSAAHERRLFSQAPEASCCCPICSVEGGTTGAVNRFAV